MGSKVPTTLLLWDQLTDHEEEVMAKLDGPFPIVLGTKLKVNNFQGNESLLLFLKKQKKHTYIRTNEI